MKTVHRFLPEAFEGKGLRIEEIIIEASEGPKAPIVEIKLRTIMSPFESSIWSMAPAFATIGAMVQSIHEIVNVKIKNDRTGLFLIFDFTFPFSFNMN